MNGIFVATVLLAVVACVHSACKSPPTLPPGGKWVPNEGCSSGGVYFTAGANRQRCHCWGHCGYICEPDNSGGGGGGSGGGGGGSGSPCPFGGVYYNKKGQKCHCQSMNKQPYYVCEDPTTTTSTSTTTPATTAAAGGATTAAATTAAATTAAATTAAATTAAATTAAATTAAATTAAATTAAPTTAAAAG